MASEWSAETLVSSLGRTGHRERLRRKSSSGSSTSEELEDRVRGTLNGLKIRLRGERLKYVKSQLEKNCLTLEQQLREVERLSRLRHNHHQLGSSAVTSSADASGGQTLDDNRGLILRNHFVLSPENSRQHHCQGPNRRPQICSKLNPGNSNARKIVFVDIARLEAVSRLPSYTAWMFVDRNERMTKDQSIARRRRISYESNGKETFFCLDAEEEAAANDGVETMKETRSLTASEEFVSRVAISEHGSGSAVLETVADFVKVSVATVESLCQSLHAARFENNNNENRGWQPAASILSVSQVFPQPIHYGLGCHMKSNGDLHQDDEHLVQKVIPKPAQANAAENGYANVKRRSNKEEGEEQSEMPTTLALALDSFDTLFCRRCLIFNCALHDCVEEIVVGANEIQPPSRTLEQDPVKPCSLACHFLVSSPTVLSPSPAGATAVAKPVCTSRCEFQRSSHMSCTSEIYKGGCCLRGGSGTVRRLGHINGQLREGDGDADDIDNEQLLLEFIETAALDVSTVDEGRFNSHEQKRRLLILKENRVKKSKKKAKKILADEVQTDSGEEEAIMHVKYGTMEDAESSSDLVLYRNEHAILNVPPLLNGDFTSFRSTNEGNDNITTTMENQDGKRGRTSDYWCSANRNISEKRLKRQPTTELVNNRWNILEQDLCEKGIQIFGKNSCLIAQNILKGCKSCQEIYEYINKQEKTITNARLSGDESSSTARVLSNTENELRSMELRSMEMLFHTGRVYRPPKFRFGRKKIAPKIALRPIQKRIGSGEGSAGVQNTLYPHYTPCSCESRAGCGRECPCALRNMHCEKYCGCFKVCKNRFRGCQCAKSMCDRRNCPCFAAGRECDPDVCKFCRIDCGHGHISSGECNNMRILFRKKKRLLLAQSDVCTGWGVFTRHPLGKNEYVGEYTGELILHSEADRRGRIYDQETSFLFNLNEKLVVDAFRKGNKLKFANHSSIRANCYAKVVLVGGDHRVGIFAKYKIQAGEELLYDYQYEPEIAPLWATTLS